MTPKKLLQVNLLIAGSRSIENEELIFGFMNSFLVLLSDVGVSVVKVITGDAKGVDALAKAWASQQKLPCDVFEARWDEQGKSAGPIRNRRMATECDYAVVFWDGKSRGASNMVQTLRENRFRLAQIVIGEMHVVMAKLDKKKAPITSNLPQPERYSF